MALEQNVQVIAVELGSNGSYGRSPKIQPKAVALRTSRMNREVHVRFCEGLWVKFPGPTRSWPARPPASRAAYLGKPAAAPPTTAHASLVCVSTPGHSGSFNFVDGYNDEAGIIIESDDDKYFALDSDNKLFPILPWDPNSTVGIPARIAITYKRARWSGINAQSSSSHVALAAPHLSAYMRSAAGPQAR
jgi:hypothetical protein